MWKKTHTQVGVMFIGLGSWCVGTWRAFSRKPRRCSCWTCSRARTITSIRWRSSCWPAATRKRTSRSRWRRGALWRLRPPAFGRSPWKSTWPALSANSSASPRSWSVCLRWLHAIIRFNQSTIRSIVVTTSTTSDVALERSERLLTICASNVAHKVAPSFQQDNKNYIYEFVNPWKDTWSLMEMVTTAYKFSWDGKGIDKKTHLYLE